MSARPLSSPVPKSTLARGLRVLEALSVADGPLRFSDLKALLPGLTDSTVSRLLQTLETDGYVAKESTLGYVSGPALRAWFERMAILPKSAIEVFRQVALNLSWLSNESAAIAILQDARLTVVASQLVEGAVSIIGVGGCLHFEADHAGSMALLSALTNEERAALLQGAYSRIADERAYAEALKVMRVDEEIFRDASLLRPGISRMAVAFEDGDIRGVLFLCLTRESAEQNFDSFAEGLRIQKMELLTGLKQIS